MSTNNSAAQPRPTRTTGSKLCKEKNNEYQKNVRHWLQQNKSNKSSAATAELSSSTTTTTITDTATASAAAAMNSNTTADSSDNEEQITKKAKMTDMKLSAATTTTNNNNSNNVDMDMDMDTEEAGKNSGIARVSTSPKPHAQMDIDEDVTATTRSELHQLLNKGIPELARRALAEAGGKLTEPIKVRVSDKKIVDELDASKYVNALAAQIDGSKLVHELDGKDLSCMITSKYGDQPTINPDPQRIVLGGEEMYGKMGNINTAIFKTFDLTSESDMEDLVNSLQNLGIENMSVEQQSAILFEFTRTLVCQCQLQKKIYTGDSGKSLPTGIVTRVADHLNHFITSIENDKMEGVVRDLSIVILHEYVGEAQDSEKFDGLSNYLQDAVREFWNGYSKNATQMYDEEGGMTAVDDTKCYKRLPGREIDEGDESKDEKETWKERKDEGAEREEGKDDDESDSENDSGSDDE